MRRMVLVAGCGIALGAPGGASAAGGPVPPMQGGAGVGAPAGVANFVAVGVRGGTLVEQVLRPGGAIARTRMLRGSYGVPGVAYDGSTTGLAADGRTLVLAEILDRFPVRRSRLAVLDARRLRVVRRITLSGYHTVDAISPTGRWLYLVRYLRQDGARYEVRAYDLVRNRLAPDPVVDRREAGEKMQGFPMTRATSPDGRWAYTLYDRPGAAPFIHALDTERRAAACIDVAALAGTDLSSVRLSPPRGTEPLIIRRGALAPLAVDVRSRTVRPAAVSAPRVSARARAETSTGLLPWLLGLAAAAGIGAALFGAARRAASPSRPPASALRQQPLGEQEPDDLPRTRPASRPGQASSA